MAGGGGMSKLRPGGLALIINAVNPENIGKVVELVAYLGVADTHWINGEPYNGGNVPCWRVRATGESFTLWSWKCGKELLSDGVTPEAWLAPLDDQDTETSDTDAERSIKEPA